MALAKPDTRRSYVLAKLAASEMAIQILLIALPALVVYLMYFAQLGSPYPLLPFLGYVMLKTRSVWLAAFGHAMFNSGYQWLTLVVNTPNDPLYAFGPGIYGIAFTFLLALVILRDPVWKQI